MIVSSPSSIVRQVSGQHPELGFILSVLVKLTYTIDRSGRCLLADEQVPLHEDITFEENSDEIVAHDTDLLHWKPLTDIVVLGHARVRDPIPEFTATVRVGDYAKSIRVCGERRAYFDHFGRVNFTPPTPLTDLPLSFRYAYGGRDRWSETERGYGATRFADYLPAVRDVAQLSPYLYPRNPCGRGYLVELRREAIEALALPQLEDPQDRLRADRLAAGDIGRWPEMPVPQSLGWFGHAWFPRTSYLGLVRAHVPPTQPIFEVRQGWVASDVLQQRAQPYLDMRIANGASLGLQVPNLRGDESGVLLNLARTSELRFTLPGDTPRIWTDGRKGKLNETAPVIHSLIIEPDASRLSIVWRGCAPALRLYATAELANMPLRVTRGVAEPSAQPRQAF